MKVSNIVFRCLAFGLLFVSVPLQAHAVDPSLSVTITPPLFQLSISPGQTWKSSIKVVNSNAYDVTYYAYPMDFAAQGESGQGSLSPVVDVPTDGSASTYSLAQWVQISRDPIVVPQGKSYDIPFSVSVPMNAEPGGHYAALLVGTQPPLGKSSGPSMKVSSFVSSLLFVKVEGSIQELGRIREFRPHVTLYQTPEARFLLRFENLGNTHLKPQGVITIYNMWGKKRGELVLNKESNFGNVLPKSIRKFEFSWTGDASLFDIGQYKAEVTLNFGDGDKQNVSATSYFWVVPVMPVAATLVSIVLFVLSMIWFIRRYIRQALAIEAQKAGIITSAAAHPVQSVSEGYIFKTLIQPIREGVVDLRRVGVSAKPEPVEQVQESTLEKVSRFKSGRISLLEFIKTYNLFFLFVGVLIAAGVVTYFFFAKVLVPERSFEIREVKTQVENL
jgi:hypothetical protein